MSTSEPPVGLPEGDLTGAITRLAEELFARVPGSAGHVPPVPGAATTPPLWAIAPPPTESDLRTLPLTIANVLGGSAPLALVETPPTLPSVTPYFLGIAGHPSPASSPALPAAPASPGPLALPEWPTSPAFPAQPVATATPANAVPAAAPEISPSRSIITEFQPELVPDLDLPSVGGIFDPLSIKRDFPILEERVHGRRLVWLDNAATTQKPRAVIERLSYFYEHENSNVHRAAHELAARATDAYDSARDKVARFLNAPSAKNIVFVRGATEAINLVAQSWGRRHVGEGDEIDISCLEHHANIVPWQQLTAATGARLRVAPVDDRGQVIVEEYEKLLGPRTRLVSLSQVSNALGTIVPVKEMIEIAHRYGARVMIDGAQAVSHLPVRRAGARLRLLLLLWPREDLPAPTGIGALFGKNRRPRDHAPLAGAET